MWGWSGGVGPCGWEWRGPPTLPHTLRAVEAEKSRGFILGNVIGKTKPKKMFTLWAAPKLKRLTAYCTESGREVSTVSRREDEGCWTPQGNHQEVKGDWFLLVGLLDGLSCHRIRSLEAVAGFHLQMVFATSVNSRGSEAEEKPEKLKDWVLKEKEITH